MGKINKTALPFFRFAFVRPNVDLGALNVVHTSMGMSEAEWIDRSVARAMSVSNGARTNGVFRLLGQVDEMRAYVRDALTRIEAHRNAGHQQDDSEWAVISSFDELGNSRVMLALKCDSMVRHRAAETLWWSDLYDRAVRSGDELTESQQRELQLLAPRLEERVRETVDVLNAPVRGDTNVHRLFVSVASLGLIHQETMFLAGKAVQRSVLDALHRLTKSPNIYLRHAAAVALMKQAVSLRASVPMISSATRGWVRVMRSVVRMRREVDPGSDRDQLLTSLIEHARLLVPHMEGRHVQTVAGAILALRNDEEESSDLRAAANQVFAELVDLHPRLYRLLNFTI